MSFIVWIPKEKLFYCNREYQEGDAKGADLVIAASNCREVNRRVYEECQKAHIPVNTADDRELCDFIFRLSYWQKILSSD